MRLLELTLPSAAANLALDEALLDEAEAAGEPCETLRLWEPAQTMVVMGRSSKIADEVDVAACRATGVEVYRRASGGAAVVTGQGCLMYAVVLSYQLEPGLRAVDAAHRHVLGRIVAALRRCAPDVACRGVSDLALGDLKFSGNSVRCKREHLLYHGTLLYRFPLDAIARYLKMPPRVPAYRGDRAHGAFVTNLPLEAARIRQALVDAFQAGDCRHDWPESRTAQLVAERYAQPAWNA
jgi:lipoate---protein ligase